MSMFGRCPVRLIGKTVDRKGKDCFALNLQAREQHIRRDKAIITSVQNQGLLALQTTVFNVSALNPAWSATDGDSEPSKGSLCRRSLTKIPGVKLKFPQAFSVGSGWNDIAPPQKFWSRLSDKDNVGPDLIRFGIQNVSNAQNCFLVALTEKRTRIEIDALAKALADVLQRS
ncbi:MAG: hypothetical protein U0936_01875 [Planctomycetaceae bacterium]